MAGPKVLIVDDEPQIRRFLRASLQAHDYDVLEAENGKEAVKACTVQKPDLVILDLGLPDMDGLDVLKTLREWSTVPVIVLSIRSDDQDKIGALDRGANDYVTKPFSMGELLARMRVALRQGRGDAETDAVKAIHRGGDPVPVRHTNVAVHECIAARQPGEIAQPSGRDDRPLLEPAGTDNRLRKCG